MQLTLPFPAQAASRFFGLHWFFWVALGLALGSVYVFLTSIYYPVSASPRSEKRVLAMGGGVPTLQEMSELIDAFQQTPLDGLILGIATSKDTRGVAWTIFGDQRIDQPQFDRLAERFSGFNWGRLTDNFLRVNVYPATVDWFDNFDTILANFEAIARLSQQLGFSGIMLDTEQYPGIEIFDYPQQKYKDQYDYTAYDAQVFLRGQEIIRALNRGYPGITVLYTYGLTIGAQFGGGRDLLAYTHSGLLTPFIEGMIDAAGETTMLVDAFEGSYTYTQEAEFLAAYKLIKDFTRDVYARNPAAYGEVVEAGFGLWLDRGCGEAGLSSTTCGFRPESFQNAVDLALRYSDRYVWIYSQTVNWYTGEGIPPEWEAALNSFRQENSP
jgi:hypothetical protein